MGEAAAVALSVLTELRRRSASRLAIDDFGTGYTIAGLDQRSFPLHGAQDRSLVRSTASLPATCGRSAPSRKRSSRLRTASGLRADRDGRRERQVAILRTCGADAALLVA